MPKQIEAIYGINVQDMLTSFSHDLYIQGEITEPQRSIIGELMLNVNLDACCSNGQADTLKNHINRSAKRRPMLSLEGKPVNTGIISLSAFANSCRVRCGDCLREPCTHRDPEYPVDSVRAERSRRAETWTKKK